MLHGIDVSNWQKGLKLPESLDFCIIKATEGFRYVDPYCDGFVQQCISKGILFGFYHFARNNDPESEAIHFRSNTIGYEIIGIPVLDIEDSNIADWGSWAQRFVDKYHAMTGVYPIIYASASTLQRFNGYPLVDTCGLWIAGYTDAQVRGIAAIPDFTYSVSPWKFAAIWQYTNRGKIPNYDGELDLDVAYMDRDAWKKYASAGDTSTQEVDPTTQWPSIQNPSTSDNKNWHFENSKLSIDIQLK